MTQSSGGSPSEDQAMRERLAKLGQDLGARQRASAPPDANLPGPGNLGSAMSLGFRVMSEFVAAVAVGGVIGWQLDRWAGTSPLFLILLLALGTAAGFWSVYRLATKSTGLPGKR